MFILFFFFLLLSINVTFSEQGEKTVFKPIEKNPFTPKASVIRYWNQQIQNNLPKPSFLLSKASPLSAIDSAMLTQLHDKDVNFASYSDKNFTNYGNSLLGGADTFKNYSQGENVVADSFRRYGRGSVGHDEKFTNYEPESNVVDGSFTTYGTSTTGGTSEFKKYDQFVNVPNLRFASYGSDSNARNQAFTSYGKNSNGLPTEFTSYGKSSNVIGSTFTGYGEQGNGATETFTSYAFNSNNPQNNFASYGDGDNAGTEDFTSYRDQANDSSYIATGDDNFQSYGKNANAEEVNFANYGKSFNQGTDTFKGYGKGNANHEVGFKIYGVNTTFKDYSPTDITFSKYTNSCPDSLTQSGKAVNRWVEPGKFFHESMLKQGTVMPMPDISDKMPKRSFLPRTISSKLPFSMKRVAELKQIFHTSSHSSMERFIEDTVQECERKPSPDESK
ncbi:hypothetical protein IFM89_008748 [Coptis chinensis]|uniref:BURP domain-containing protein n=1 Tax=Coptis chinensis TaxID=261450 RepID=A0A835LR39_9MAGN|nr:hypothetical protein IFM89_008748 [Coptis chinensis]